MSTAGRSGPTRIGTIYAVASAGSGAGSWVWPRFQLRSKRSSACEEAAGIEGLGGGQGAPAAETAARGDHRRLGDRRGGEAVDVAAGDRAAPLGITRARDADDLEPRGLARLLARAFRQPVDAEGQRAPQRRSHRQRQRLAQNRQQRRRRVAAADAAGVDRRLDVVGLDVARDRDLLACGVADHPRLAPALAEVEAAPARSSAAPGATAPRRYSTSPPLRISSVESIVPRRRAGSPPGVGQHRSTSAAPMPSAVSERDHVAGHEVESHRRDHARPRPLGVGAVVLEGHA